MQRNLLTYIPPPLLRTQTCRLSIIGVSSGRFFECSLEFSANVRLRVLGCDLYIMIECSLSIRSWNRRVGLE